MHVICKQCGHSIPVADRPKGSTVLTDVTTRGNVHVKGGAITFGPGGVVSFGQGGKIAFGPPLPSQFTCPKCRSVRDYEPDEILGD